MANKRVFWAIQQVAFRKTGSTAQTLGAGIADAVLPLAASGVNDGSSIHVNPTAASGVADLW